jgi:hypothetical protein
MFKKSVWQNFFRFAVVADVACSACIYAIYCGVTTYGARVPWTVVVLWTAPKRS